METHILGPHSSCAFSGSGSKMHIHIMGGVSLDSQQEAVLLSLAPGLATSPTLSDRNLAAGVQVGGRHTLLLAA